MGVLPRYVYAPWACSARGSQKRATDPLGLELCCELPCGCWELNAGPLEEQPVLRPLVRLSVQLQALHF